MSVPSLMSPGNLIAHMLEVIDSQPLVILENNDISRSFLVDGDDEMLTRIPAVSLKNVCRSIACAFIFEVLAYDVFQVKCKRDRGHHGLRNDQSDLSSGIC